MANIYCDSAFWGQSFVGQLTSIADHARKKEDTEAKEAKEAAASSQ